MKMIKLHQDGDTVIVNTGQIQTIWADDRGTAIFFADGTDDPLYVDESIEQVMTKMTL